MKVKATIKVQSYILLAYCAMRTRIKEPFDIYSIASVMIAESYTRYRSGKMQKERMLTMINHIINTVALEG